MPEALRWGILSCGKIAGDFIWAFDNTQKEHKVVAVGATDLKRAKQFAVDYKVSDAAVYGNYDDLINDKNVEIIYIAARNSTHYEWTLKALDAGKHVLCEKPVALNAKQLKIMHEKAKQKGLFFMEGFWSRFFPAYTEMRRIIESGELGKPYLVEAHFGFPLDKYYFSLETGETILNLIGVYTVQFSQFVFGDKKPLTISASGDKYENGTDKWGSIRLNYAPEQDSLLSFDSRGFGPNNAFIRFEKGYVGFSGFFWAPETFTVFKDADFSEHVKEFPLKDDRAYKYPHSSGFRYEQDHVYDMIRSGKKESTLMPVQNSLRILEITDEVRKQLGVKYAADDQF